MILHHCVVIFFWSSGIMECTCMLFTFENGVPLMRKGASVVWHRSLLLMNGFNKTEYDVFSCRLCFLRAYPFISLMNSFTDLMLKCIFARVFCFVETIKSHKDNIHYVKTRHMPCKFKQIDACLMTCYCNRHY